MNNDDKKTSTLQLLITECRDHAITKEKLEETEQERDMYKEQVTALYTELQNYK